MPTSPIETLELPRHGHARVWLEDLPQASFDPTHVATHTLPGVNSTLPPRQAAFEWNIPTGPRSLYGLLGGAWVPRQGEQFELRVPTSSPSGLRLENPLPRFDDVRVGLPAEYERAIIEGIQRTQADLGSLPSGTLTINRAAHSKVNSSHMMFLHLAALLVKLVCLPEWSPSDDTLRALFPDTLK